MTGTAFLAVARVRKPHGLKGEAVVWVLTDRPEEALAVGRRVTPVDEAGAPLGDPLTIERSRPFHRQWLVKFAELGDREALEPLGQTLLGLPAEALGPPAPDELYVHEIPGATVVGVDDEVLGTATGLVDVPGGALLAVDVGGREVLVPFRRPIVTRLERARRRITVDLPPGLLELQ